MGDVCVCGHVYDEHESNGKECTIEGETRVDDCRCVLFEEDPDA